MFGTLHGFHFILMPWFPEDIIKSKEQDTHYKRDDAEVFECIIAKKRFAVKMKEFADHPVAVGTDPDSDGKVMAELTHVLAGSPGNHNGNNQCGKDHRYTQWSPDHTPGYVFKQPEYDVQVLHLPETEGNIVGLFCGHTSYKL